MSDINEALKTIFQTVKDSVAVEVVRPPAEPDHYYATYNRATNQLTWHEAQARSRRYQCETIASLIDAVKHWGSADLGPVPIFVGNGTATAILDEAGKRRERLTWHSPFTSTFQQLQALEKTRAPMEQRAFVDLLRIDLAGCVNADTVATFRDLRLKRNTVAGSEISNSRETLGKSVMAELAGAGKDLPDEISVRVRVYDKYDNDDEFDQYDVEIGLVSCAVVTDLSEMTFRLIPLAGQLIEAVQRVDNAIAEDLQKGLGNRAAVFAGKVE